MDFYFSIWNHHKNSREIILDIAEPVIAGLRDIGHNVELGDMPPRRHVMNIVVENFHYRRVAAQVRPFDFVLVATERLDGDGFNGERGTHWRKRWANFPRVAREAAAIWAVGDFNAAGYEAFAPTAQITLGWSPRLEAVTRAEPPRFDICAYGNMTGEARRATIKTLSSSLRVGTVDLATKAERDRLLSQSLFSYGFRPNAEMACASVSRIVSSLRLGIPVIQERVQMPTPLVEALEIVEGPEELLARWDELRANRASILARQLEAWRRIPASKVMSDALAVLRPKPQRFWRTVEQILRASIPNRGYVQLAR
ncbi:hypothetical protein [Desertibaculum subflavum]|uniref:hypothetical protein n=1 Tax=Desertibaculum subflavum TaxID=2268458 RepID=UPI000E67235D